MEGSMSLNITTQDMIAEIGNLYIVNKKLAARIAELEAQLAPPEEVHEWEYANKDSEE